MRRYCIRAHVPGQAAVFRDTVRARSHRHALQVWARTLRLPLRHLHVAGSARVPADHVATFTYHWNAATMADMLAGRELPMVATVTAHGKGA